MSTWVTRTIIGIGSSGSLPSFLSFFLSISILRRFLLQLQARTCITTTFMSKEHFLVTTVCFNKTSDHSRYTTLMSIAREEVCLEA
jgi:hypothetical protein